MSFRLFFPFVSFLKKNYGAISPLFRVLGFRVYLEGQGDLVSGLLTPITHIVSPFISIINPLTKSP